MADTYSSNIRVVLQQPGGNNNSWGTILNTNLDTIDAKFGDTTAISTTGGTTTLTETQEVVAAIEVTGALLSNATVVFSGRGGYWIVSNGTSGSFSLTCKVSGQTGVTIEQGGCALVYCNGTDIKYGNPPASAVAEVTVASATTADVLGANSEFVAISGTTTVTSFGTGTNRKRFCRATGAFRITHNATSLICPGAQDIVTEAGDTFVLVADASSNVRVHHYQRAAVPPSYLPVGFVGDYAGSAAPSFWLLCYGQAISRTTYAKLFDVVGETYGAGNGVTTFNLPDCRGRVVAGKDDMGGTSANRLTNQSGGLNGDTLGATGGSETHTLVTAELASHSHAAGTLAADSSGAHTHSINTSSGGNDAGAGISGNDNNTNGAQNTTAVVSSGAHTHTISGSTATSGGGGAHNNVQPTIIFNKMIFAGV